MYTYIVIRGPQEHQSLTGSSIYTLRPSAATYYHNRIYTYVVYGAVSILKKNNLDELICNIVLFSLSQAQS